MKSLRSPRWVFAALLLSPLLLTGCVSSRYKAAPKSTQPPVVHDLVARDEAAQVIVHSVVVLRGPGSWKRHAYWDEYVVSVTNLGAAPLTVQGVTLTDFQGHALHPGTSPWELEKISQTSEKRFARTAGSAVLFGAGVSIATVPAFSVAGASVLGGGVSGAAVTASAAILPAYVVGTIYRNVASRHRIMEEFERRRIPLPLELAPGTTRTGSFFFPISPGPQHFQLEVTGRPGVVVNLEPLHALHLAKPAVAQHR